MKTIDSTAASSASNKPIGRRVVIVEDQRMVAEFFGFHCRDLGLDVLPWCGTCRDGLASIRANRPDLVLLDISLPDGDGLELAKMMLREIPEVKILAISAHRDPWTMLQVQRLNLHGFVDKHEQSLDVFTDAIHAVLEGRIYYAPIVNQASAVIRKDPNAFIRVLSDYETRILSIIGHAKTDDEIAAMLNISPSTVQSRRRDIMGKLEIHATPKLMHFAILNGITRIERLGSSDPI